MCSREHINENLTPEVIDLITSGEFVYEPGYGEMDGRKGLVEEVSQAQIDIFPNPSTGTTYLGFELEEATQVSWQVMNSHGQVISQKKASNIKSGRYTVDLGTQNLPSGLYILKYELDGQTHQARFVKQ